MFSFHLLCSERNDFQFCISGTYVLNTFIQPQPKVRRIYNNPQKTQVYSILCSCFSGIFVWYIHIHFLSCAGHHLLKFSAQDMVFIKRLKQTNKQTKTAKNKQQQHRSTTDVNAHLLWKRFKKGWKLVTLKLNMQWHKQCSCVVCFITPIYIKTKVPEKKREKKGLGCKFRLSLDYLIFFLLLSLILKREKQIENDACILTLLGFFTT